MVRQLVFALALFAGSAVAWASLPSAAAAQVGAQDQAKAKRLFEEGLALGRSQRWGEALSSFRRSAELVPRASTSYNIANALYRLDRPMDGLDELARYDAFPEVRYSYEAQQRGAALRELLEDAVAEVRLAVTPMSAELFVDGRLFPAVGVDRRLRLNPGTHSLRVTHDDYASSRMELELERGSRETLSIVLEPLGTAGTAPRHAVGLTATSVTTTAAPPDDRERFVKRPGFWVMIGAIALVGVGVGVTVAMVRRDDSPECGTTGDCASTGGLTVTSF